MSRFNLADYTEVKDRIPLFYERYPEGRIVTQIVHLDWTKPATVVVQTMIYRSHDDAQPMSTGLAYEREGQGHVNQHSFVENCETSSIGRGLANCGFQGGDQRPSREEMEKIARAESEAGARVTELKAELNEILADHMDDMTSEERIAADRALAVGSVERLESAITYLKGREW